ncbi:hypothetical protein, partial [Actinoplanes regularis]
MTSVALSARDRFLNALAELRQKAGNPSYSVLVRQAAAQQPTIEISSQRLSDWFGGRALPSDLAVVRFLIGYLQPRAVRSGNYQERPLSWWLALHQNVVEQRQNVNRDV